MHIIKSLQELQTIGQIAPNSIINADCLDAMKDIPDNSIDLILTDPPYFKVKKEKWDRQWDKPNEFLKWLDTIAEQWQRILKPNGSLYCFASPKMAARVEVMLGERFNVCNHIVWNKNGRSRSAMTCKEESRIYFPESERIIFCEHYGADNIAKGEAGYEAKCDELRGFVFEPLRAYLNGELKKAGINPTLIRERLGYSSNLAHNWFAVSNSHGALACWILPLPKQYLELQTAFPNHFTRPYEDLRQQYEDLRQQYEDLRRPFSVTADVPYTDVWTFPTVQYYEGKHPCEKPLALLEHIIKASSLEGALILDSFAGSASTAIACINTNRRYICIEKDVHYFEVMRDRIANHDSNAPVKAKKPKPVPKGQLSLF